MKKIFILEDDEEICLLTSTILQRRGYDVTVANSVSIANEVLSKKTHQHDVMIVDVSLADGDGLDFMDSLSLGCCGFNQSSTPFLVVSGHAANQLEDRMALLPNFSGFIQKPYSVKELVNRIETIVNGK